MNAELSKEAGHRVLIVDDDADIQDALADVFEDAGFSTALAGDGVQALSYLRANPPPSVIVLDLWMPRMDGLQFRAEQLRDPALAGIPVVILSADQRLEEKVKTAVPNGWLAKPVDMNKLLGLVSRCCGAPVPA